MQAWCNEGQDDIFVPCVAKIVLEFFESKVNDVVMVNLFRR